MKPTKWSSPLRCDWDLPDECGRFGSRRKHDIHTGIDLYCDPGTEVIAVEDGFVVAIENFTGPNADPPSPWWNDTQSILIEGVSGVICYGEIEVAQGIEVGTLVPRGSIIGTVKTVLKKDKGRPMTMLHLELYRPGTRESVIWDLDAPCPSTLLNVEERLLDVD